MGEVICNLMDVSEFKFIQQLCFFSVFIRIVLFYSCSIRPCSCNRSFNTVLYCFIIHQRYAILLHEHFLPCLSIHSFRLYHLFLNLYFARLHLKYVFSGCSNYNLTYLYLQIRIVFHYFSIFPLSWTTLLFF